MFLWRNIEACSCNHFCSWKAISQVLHVQSVFVALGVRLAKRLRRIIQGEHKFFSWLQTFITRKLPGHVGTERCTSVRRVSAVDNFPTRWCTSTLGFRCSSGFWMQHFQTGGLGEMVRHPGHHDRQISPLLTSFYGSRLGTNCFRHQFQMLQIWRQEITAAFAAITEDMLENAWREIDYRLDVLRAKKRSTCWCALMCYKETSWVELHFEKKKGCIPRSFLVINVCNQGRNLCSPCIIICGLAISTMFFHTILWKSQFSERNFWTENMFWFSVHIFYDIFHFRNKTSSKYSHKCTYVFVWSTCY